MLDYSFEIPFMLVSYYTLFLIVSMLFFYLNDVIQKQKSPLRYSAIVFLCLLYGYDSLSRGFSGSDTYGYYLHYSTFDGTTIDGTDHADFNFEPGYEYLAQAFNYLGFSFSAMNFFLASAYIISVSWVSKKLNISSAYLSSLFLMHGFLFTLYNATRQSIAFIVFMIAAVTISKNKSRVLVLAATIFHYSSIFVGLIKYGSSSKRAFLLSFSTLLIVLVAVSFGIIDFGVLPYYDFILKYPRIDIENYLSPVYLLTLSMSLIWIYVLFVDRSKKDFLYFSAAIWVFFNTALYGHFIVMRFMIFFHFLALIYLARYFSREINPSTSYLFFALSFIYYLAQLFTGSAGISI